MLRLLALFIFFVGCLLTSDSALASDFEIRLQIEDGEKRVQTQQTEESPTVKKSHPRPVVELRRDRPVNVAWHAENTGKSTVFPDVLIHFFVVSEDKVGQVKVPKLTESVVYEGAMTMDFKPHEKADWKFALHIREPGTYLLRAETIGMKEQHGHEHWTAMDLIVK